MDKEKLRKELEEKKVELLEIKYLQKFTLIPFIYSVYNFFKSSNFRESQLDSSFLLLALSIAIIHDFYYTSEERMENEILDLEKNQIKNLS